MLRRLSIIVLFGAFVAASARLFIWPSPDKPQEADAILILGGGGHRRPVGYDLARAGLSKTLAVSTSDTDKALRGSPEFVGVEVIKFRPEPFTTQGEARYLAEQAHKRGWKRVIVVSGREQMTRARLRIRRCYDGELLMVAAPRQLRWVPYDVVYEWAAMAKALVLERGC
ncbi:MAG: YdcF family protein [Acidimicrobiales bacterium]